MKVSLQWLTDYVDITVTPAELAHRLTMSGSEVGSINYVGAGWENILVARVLELKPHPNADKLSLARVTFGDDAEMTVVTGAPNLVVGQKVPLARVGARLIDSHAAQGAMITIKPSKLRGIVSEGMLCSARELGLGENHEGILILPSDAPVGVPLREVLGDAILDIEVTPNRPDELSMIGVAREAGALTGQALHVPQEVFEDAGQPVSDLISIAIDAPELCPRYTATIITGVTIGPSPRWMQDRLMAAGMRPINNVVDITNYVLLEWGQPLHAFDYDLIRGQRIIVRRALPGETIVSLDGVERELTPEMLVIADAERAVAIAGVMGGAASEVGPDTTTILLESANFDGLSIRRTSRDLRLRTEASLRFEKGLDRELPIPAVRRASQLIKEIAGGVIARGVADNYPLHQEARVIDLPASEVHRLLGVALTPAQMADSLRRLHFVCEERPQGLLVTVPGFRRDVNLPADLCEEIARLVGYDNLPTTTLRGAIPAPRPQAAAEAEQHLRRVLLGCGLDEAINYSLIGIALFRQLYATPEDATAAGVLDIEQAVHLANPMTEDQEYLRTSLLPGLLRAVSSNLRHTLRVRLFEIGRIYLPRAGQLPEERTLVDFVMTGAPVERSWGSALPAVDFFDAKGIVEEILRRLGVANAVFNPGVSPGFHPGRTAFIEVVPPGGGSAARLGLVGELHPAIAERFDMPPQRMCACEMNLSLLASLARPQSEFLALPRYPAVMQDIAVVLDREIPAAEVEAVIRRAGGDLVRDVTLFDVYEGEPIPREKKSLAFSITYLSAERTLTDEQVARVHARIARQLQDILKAQLRG